MSYIVYKDDMNPTEIEYDACDLTCYKCDWEGDLEVRAFLGHDTISFDWTCPVCGTTHNVQDSK